MGSVDVLFLISVGSERQLIYPNNEFVKNEIIGAARPFRNHVGCELTAHPHTHTMRMRKSEKEIWLFHLWPNQYFRAVHRWGTEATAIDLPMRNSRMNVTMKRSPISFIRSALNAIENYYNRDKMRKSEYNLHSKALQIECWPIYFNYGCICTRPHMNRRISNSPEKLLLVFWLFSSPFCSDAFVLVFRFLGSFPPWFQFITAIFFRAGFPHTSSAGHCYTRTHLATIRKWCADYLVPNGFVCFRDVRHSEHSGCHFSQILIDEHHSICVKMRSKKKNIRQGNERYFLAGNGPESSERFIDLPTHIIVHFESGTMNFNICSCPRPFTSWNCLKIFAPITKKRTYFTYFPFLPARRAWCLVCVTNLCALTYSITPLKHRNQTSRFTDKIAIDLIE